MINVKRLETISNGYVDPQLWGDVEYIFRVLPDLLQRCKELEDALVEERASGLFNGPWISDLPEDSGYDAEMEEARKEARRQLTSEGKL